jgi:alkyl hydroperoxide reductase subunit AhpC
MIELGQLEESWQEFDKRKVRVVVVSLEDPATALLTQTQFPHLLVLGDSQRGLSEKLEVIHPDSAPDGSDTTAPTTILVDGTGAVRWTFRPGRFFTRLTPGRVLAAVDEHLGPRY